MKLSNKIKEIIQDCSGHVLTQEALTEFSLDKMFQENITLTDELEELVADYINRKFDHLPVFN